MTDVSTVIYEKRYSEVMLDENISTASISAHDSVNEVLIDGPRGEKGDKGDKGVDGDGVHQWQQTDW